MNDIEILPLITDLIGSFFRSSRDALERARCAQADKSLQNPTGLNIFPELRAETQASLESIVFSFLTVEATINYIFFNVQRTYQLKGMDRWLRKKWKRNLSVYDRFVLLVNQYSSANLDDFQILTTLFSEFITFRNRIVHAVPEQYHALVESGLSKSEALLHDVEPVRSSAQFPASLFSEEVARITCDDAKRGFEIMLLVISFLDEQLIAEFELPWKYSKDKEEYLKPRDIIAVIDFRYYPNLRPDSFVPAFIKKLNETA